MHALKSLHLQGIIIPVRGEYSASYIIGNELGLLITPVGQESLLHLIELLTALFVDEQPETGVYLCPLLLIFDNSIELLLPCSVIQGVS